MAARPGAGASEAAVDGPQTRIDGALAAVSAVLEELHDVVETMAGASLDDLLQGAGMAGRVDPGVEGQLVTKMRGFIAAFIAALGTIVPGDAPAEQARAEAHLFEGLRCTIGQLAVVDPGHPRT